MIKGMKNQKFFKPNHFFKAALIEFVKLNECEQIYKQNEKKKEKA